MTSLKTLKGLFRLALPMWPWMLLAIILGVLGFMAAAAIPAVSALVLGTMMAGLDVSLSLCFWILGLCAVFRGVLRYGEQACNHYIAFRLLAHIRDLVFGALRKLAPAKLDGRSKGDLITLITNDVELLEVFYAHTISPVAIAILCSLIYSAIGFAISWQAGIWMLFGYAAVAFIPVLLTQKESAKAGNRYRARAGKLNAYVLESAKGMRELIEFDQTDKRLENILKQSDALFEDEKTLKTSQAFSMSLVHILIMAVSVGLCIILGPQAANGTVSPASVVFLMAFQLSTFGPVTAVANLSTGLSQTIGAAGRVLNLLDEKPLTPDVEAGVQAGYDSMELNNVSFAYQDGQPVLENLDLQISKGGILGISGPSGCGKSTLLRLLMRFFDPASGSVKLSGQRLDAVKTDSLRALQGCVLQETVLFSGTIADNLRMVKEGASDEQIMSACKKAAVHDWIMSLPEGYNSLVEEGGSNLSAGQKQRLGLARAFLHDSKILLLDEPTSNLDALNEGAILKAVAEEKKGRTVILVSHRKGTLNFADQHLVMTSLKLENTV